MALRNEARNIALAGTLLALLSLCRLAVAGDVTKLSPGFLVLSIAQQDGTRFSSTALYYRSRATGEIDHVSYRDVGLFNLATDDIDDADKTGVVKVEELAPGDYELFTFSVVSGGYPGERRYAPPQDFKIPFSIRAGEATYLGEYMVVSAARNRILGITIHGDPYFVISDQHERDVTLAKKRHKEITAEHDDVPNAGAMGLPFFRSKSLP